MPAPFRLDGKVALITGGASGIGEATCRLFTQQGARVIIADIDEARAKALSAGLPGSQVVVGDISSEQSVARMFAGIQSLDILVNNAGIGLVGGIMETEVADWDRVLQVNVTGMFLVTKAAMPLLLAAKGSIINLGSVASLVGVRKRFAYCAAKGAVVAMTRQLALDFPTEIRVNCICPGTVDSPFVEGYLDNQLGAHVHDVGLAVCFEFLKTPRLPFEHGVGHSFEGLSQHDEAAIVRIAGPQVKIAEPALPPAVTPFGSQHDQVKRVRRFDLEPGMSPAPGVVGSGE